MLLFDESGDLGFNLENAKTSRYFVVAFLIATDTKQVASAVKKVFRGLSKVQIKRSHGVLHAFYEDRATRMRLLEHLSKRDVSVATMKLDKRLLTIAEDPHQLYSSMVLKLINRLHMDGHLSVEEEIRLVASQKDTNKLHKIQFITVVKDGASPELLEVEIEKPAHEKGLQAVDFVAWSFWRKYEKGDAEYADILAAKVLAEYDYY
jgi:hypothetical protein